MRLRSTGLGPMELQGNLVRLEKKMTGLYMEVEIYEPAMWKVRVFLQKSDLKKLPFLILKPRNVRFILKNLFCVQQESVLEASGERIDRA